MEKVKELLKKMPDWVKAVVASAMIIAVAIPVEALVTNWASEQGRRKVSIIKEDDYSHVFQVDTLNVDDGKMTIEGWVFKLNEDAEENDFAVVLYDYINDKKYYPQMQESAREDVNEYFLCEYDYTASGFAATIRSKKLDLENINYEVLIQNLNDRSAFATGIYISEGKLMHIKPEEYTPLDVSGTTLQEIVDNGVLRMYRPDVGMYVYQYDGYLYWITDNTYEFSGDGKTVLQYRLDTTQLNNLPQAELRRDYRVFTFETEELKNNDSDNYRVARYSIPTEYSITKITTGYAIGPWIWVDYFRPWYELR